MYQLIGKMFPLGKIQFWAHFRFCIYHRNFRLWKAWCLPHPKVWGTFFQKKLSIGRQNFLAKSVGSCFRSCQEEQLSKIHFPVMWTQLIYKFPPTILGYSLEVEALTFSRTVQEFIVEGNSLESLTVVSGSVSLILTMTWGNYILSEKLTAEIGGCVWKTLFAHNLCLWNFMQSLSCFKTSLMETCIFMPWL